MEILLAILLGFGGGWYVHQPDKFDCKEDALIVASCPQLTTLDDATFGGHILKLQEVAGQYRECRQACLPYK
jgi:hypothetical protein